MLKPIKNFILKLSKLDKLGILLFGCCLLILISLSILTWILDGEDKYNEITLCPLNTPISGHTVFFIDRTDPLNKRQTQWLLEEIRLIKNELKRDEKFSIYRIIGSKDNFLRNIFSLCSPQSGKEANPLYENPKRIQKKYEERFGEPLEKALLELTTGSQYPTSPIMETIKANIKRVF